MSYNIPVKSIMKEWNVEWNQTLSKGRKVYIDCNTSDTSATQLPTWGDAWTTDSRDVVSLWGLNLKNTRIEYMEDNPHAPRKYILDYDSRPLNEPDTLGTIPYTVETDMASSFISFSNPAGQSYWKWQDNNETIQSDLRLGMEEAVVSLNVKRFIYGGSFTDWTQFFVPYVGCINSGSFLGFASKNVKFEGSSMRDVGASGFASKKWEVNMKFTICAFQQNGNYYDWTYVFDPNTASYRVPTGNGNKLYQVADLGPLLSKASPQPSFNFSPTSNLTGQFGGNDPIYNNPTGQLN